MHRALNVKHRIVRRVDIGKAPLATFDTIDLGDEDVSPIRSQSTQFSNDSAAIQTVLNFNSTKLFLPDGSLKTETIGGNNSKKSLSLAGGEEKGGKDAEVARDKSKGGGEEENPGDRNENSFVPTDSPLVEAAKCAARPPETNLQKQDFAPAANSGDIEQDTQRPSTVQSLSRQGTIGRVSIPIKKQDSDSSSSSGSCNENTPTFHVARPSVGHLESSDLDGNLCDLGSDRDCQSNLLPDNIDPSQILSPSKRKAYERRIERLRVTTSPIARPRSHTPISVVTLDEYATISSPESSPAPPAAIPDKLKITLPCDEFTLKPKTPKLQSARRKDSDETCFEFAEDILFSRTKSALVVNEDGLIPVSPRRVLIPPTITPTTSPKLSAAPRLSANSPYEEYSNTPKLLYIQQNETALNFFGETVDETEEENWASFPDSSCPVSSCTENKIDQCDLSICDSNTTVDQTEIDVGERLQSDSLVAKELETGPVICSKTAQDSDTKIRDLDNLHAVVYNIESDASSHSTGLVELESDEILTVEINHLEKGCEKHIEIDIKPSGSLSPVDIESLGVPVKLLPQDISQTDLSSQSRTTLNSGNNRGVDQCSTLTHGPKNAEDSGSGEILAHQENDSAPYDETTDLFIEEFLPQDTCKSQPLSHAFESQAYYSKSAVLGPKPQIDPQDKGHQSNVTSDCLVAARIVPVSKVLKERNHTSEPLSIDEFKENFQSFKTAPLPPPSSCFFEEQSGVPPPLPERPLSINLFEKVLPPLPQRPSGSNLFDDKSQASQRVPPPVPERPPSTNLFEENLQVLEKVPPPIPERPPSVNICDETLKPFEVPPVLQQRPPSTNPFEDKLDRNPPPLPKRPTSGSLLEEKSPGNVPPPIPQRSPSSNPLEARLEPCEKVPLPLPLRPPSTNPFEAGFRDQVLDPFDLGLQPPNTSSGSAVPTNELVDLFLLLDSHDSSA